MFIIAGMQQAGPAAGCISGKQRRIELDCLLGPGKSQTGPVGVIGRCRCGFNILFKAFVRQICPEAVVYLR